MAEKAEFAFLVVKQKDGRIAIGNLQDYDAERQPTVDDIFTSLTLVLRDLSTQQMVGALMNVIQQVANPQQTKGGIIVPEPSNKFKKVSRAK